ncbi:MAG: thiol reductant ABC exporter subunit CydC [Bacillus sp. (in: firmicutes)]
MVQDSWVKPYLKQNKQLLALVIVLGIAAFLSAAALMFTSGFLISKSATKPENVLLVYIPIVLVRAFGIARPVFKYLERLASHNLVLQFLSKMRVRLYRRLERQALSLKSRFATGDLLGVLADDLEHIQNLYLRTVFPTVFALFLYIIVVVALGYFSLIFALAMALLLFILVVLLPLVSLLVLRKRQAKLKQTRHYLYKTLADAVMGINDWKISGRQTDFLTSYENQEKQQDEIEHSMERFNQLRNMLFHVIVLCIILLMIWFASSHVEASIFSHIWIAAFVLVVFPLIEAFAPIPDAISHLPQYERSLARLNSIEHSDHEVENNNIQLVQSLLESGDTTIEFKDVSFLYEKSGQQLILNQVSFQIKTGERVALLGKSGAGKSTLAKLLLGSLSPVRGQVTINGASVHNFNGDMSNLIAVLQQKPHLFDSSVLNNIRLGNPQASDEEVYEAAKQVQLHEYICSLPEGYHTRMRELGARFSGGERQRIALARILLQKTPIVILDEPTVGLDAITERALLQTIFNTLKGKTIIWITHHLIGVEQMDQVIYLEKGKIIMQGTHQELLRTNGRYSRLYQLDCPQI